MMSSSQDLMILSKCYNSFKQGPQSPNLHISIKKKKHEVIAD